MASGHQHIPIRTPPEPPTRSIPTSRCIARRYTLSVNGQTGLQPVRPSDHHDVDSGPRPSRGSTHTGLYMRAYKMYI